MEELARAQKELGDSIERIITNFKKDGQERKTTKEYYVERLNRLQETSEKFRAHDALIKATCGTDRSHPYFVNDYHVEIMSRAIHYKRLFEEAIRTFDKQPGEARPSISTSIERCSSPELATPTNQSDDDWGLHPVKGLIRRQTAMKSSLQRQLQTLTIVSDSQGDQFLKIKRQNIINLWQQIEELNYKIYEQSETPQSLGYDEDEFVSLEAAVEDKLIQLASVTRPAVPLHTTHDAPLSITTHQALPKITIPKFDGDYVKWPQFFDLFTEVIHNSSISTVQKFWYLKTNLTGEAERLIRHFSMTAENYMSAWETLKDRFNNERTLTSCLIQKLVGQPGFNETMNATAVKNLHDNTKETILALKNLKIDTSSWDPLLLHLLLKKIDKQTHTLYEQSLTHPKINQSVDDFLLFLEHRFQSLEAIGRKDKFITQKSATALISTQKDDCCPACGEPSHSLFNCKSFVRLTVPKRAELIKKHNRCFNCLKTGHRSTHCASGTCSKCNKKHNTLLHRENQGETEAQRSTSKPAILLSSEAKGFVILGTARVRLVTSNGQEIECRALLDSGSQVNLITEKIVRKLGLNPRSATVCIEGIANKTKNAYQRVCLNLQSRINGFKTPFEALVLQKIISQQPSRYIDITSWSIPENITLADPSFNHPGEINVLLGAEFFHQFLSIGQIRLGDSLPTLQNTVLGWIVSGRSCQDHTNLVACGVFEDPEESTDVLISKFWRIDDFEDGEVYLTEAEKRCEKHFQQHTRRNSDGRYIVKLPLCRNATELGDSSTIALNRFLAIERRLSRNDQLKEQYTQFMREYEQLGHMKEIKHEDILSPRYFIPHHCVIKADSTTTKLRVVFDASCKTTSGLSLNDIMHNGPTVQGELFSILLRFRLPRFVMTTDIEKMYRQIMIHEDNEMLHLIIWRENPNSPLKYYRLRTVTYGTRAAPYLATKCLESLAKEVKHQYPLGACVLQENFYVDDGLFGSDRLPEAKDMQQQLSTILSSAGMKLRKWSANHPSLLQGIASSDKEVDLDFTSNKVDVIKTLGLVWIPKEDCFKIKTDLDVSRRTTKRTITSDIAKIFDPLGLLAPIVVTAKMFIQKLWQLKLDWDEAVPLEMHSRWMSFRNSLQELNNITIPRHVFNHQNTKSIQLHGFADASEKAYGAAIYVRATLQNGTIIVRLLCAKSRVAPLKTQTIPRLELCAALLAAELMKRVKRDLTYEDKLAFLWTDSEIVLSWINACPSTYQTFVAHRIAKIQANSLPEQWRHVRSKDNPADLLSRGILPKEIATCHLWLCGPFFLHDNESVWPGPFRPAHDVCNELERKRASHVVVTSAGATTGDWIYQINANNSFRMLQCIIGYALRFVKRTKGKTVPRHMALDPEELDAAQALIIKTIQQIDFKDDIKHLQKAKEVAKLSTIGSLSPFLDAEGLLRVGGRLESSSLSYDAKHPMLLPYNDPIVKQLLEAIHKEKLHCGPQALLAHLRQRFWPIKGKIMARSVVQHCVRCTRARPTMYQQIMGNLPAHRVQPARPFINAGVDYCGPFWVHFKLRGKRPQKAYISVFCCFATKAVHLELVTELTTEAFLGALKRFIARRGHCQNLYCDNATNFVGAGRELQELSSVIHSDTAKETIIRKCSEKGIKFNFIPPRAPHFGGLWEAAVKSAKHLLVRTTANANLTYEEMETVVIEIEAILNSRPLIPMSSDPNDLCALTPGHFLIGEPITSITDIRATPNHARLLERWKLVSHLKHEFWKRWSIEYLSELQQKNKWREIAQNVQSGQLVIIREDNTPTMQWPIGRIVHTYKGNDGSVRVADIKTAKGVFKRSIHRLAPLLPENQNDTLKGHEQTDEPRLRPEIPKKKRKINVDWSLSMILTLVLLPIVLSNPVKITHHNSNDVMNFEHIGTTRLINSQWKLVVYFDMELIRNQILTIQNKTNELAELCKTFSNGQDNMSCQAITHQLLDFGTELQANSLILGRKRIKRGAVDLVGNVAHSLFGVLDSEYANDMSKTINEIKDNEIHLTALLKNHTSVIDSTVNLIKTEEAQIKRKFDHIDEQIQLLAAQLNMSEGNSFQSRAFQVLTTLYMQLVLAIMKMQEMHSAIFNALTDTQHGKINPLILSPVQLQEEILKIKTHLSSTTQLPVTPQDFLQMYSLMSITGTITTDHVIFNILLPLVNVESYDLFAVNAIPRVRNNSIMIIQPTSPLLAFASHRDRYFPLSENQLEGCHNMQDKTFICPNIQSTYNTASGISSCEVQLFLNESTDTCQWIKVISNLSFVRTYCKNRWFFATTTSTRMSAVCEENTLNMVLNGTGVLTAEAGCTLKINAMTTHVHKTEGIHSIHQNSQLTSFSQFNESLVPDAPVLVNTNPYEINYDTIQSLQRAISQMKTSEEVVPSHHHLAVSYTSLGCSLVAIVIIGLGLLKLKHQRKRVPKPKPRKLEPQNEFTVTVT